jgi:dTDP-4-dehydrorhamnose reductase
MRIAVIGSNGQLGSDIARAFESNGDEVLQLTHEDIAIENLDSVSRVLNNAHADLIVNTAAMHHVEKCESEPERAFAVNALGSRNLASVSDAIGASLVHVSTDYVFDGKKGKPYEETDAPMPLNVYGNTKLSGEYFVRSKARKHFVLRVSAIYGDRPCRAKGGLNFVEIMLKLAREKGKVRVVDSEFVTPTPTKEIAEQIVKLSRSENYGLYHATAEGSCSWYEFAKEIFVRTSTKVDLQIAAPNEFAMKVTRPTYSVLENRRLKEAGLNVFKPWQTGLQDYLEGKLQGSIAGK